MLTNLVVIPANIASEFLESSFVGRESDRSSRLEVDLLKLPNSAILTSLPLKILAFRDVSSKIPEKKQQTIVKLVPRPFLCRVWNRGRWSRRESACICARGDWPRRGPASGTSFRKELPLILEHFVFFLFYNTLFFIWEYFLFINWLDFSMSMTSFMPRLARWKATELPATPEPTISANTLCVDDFLQQFIIYFEIK